MVVMRRAPYRPASAGFASAEGLAVMAHLLVIGGDGLAGVAISARDHSARIEKRPVALSAICQASSSVRSRLVRARQNWRVRPIRLSLAACAGFIEGLTVGFLPCRAPGLRSWNPTDGAGPT